MSAGVAASPPGVELVPMRWWHIEQCLAIEDRVFERTAWSRESFWGELARVPRSRHYVVAVASDRPAHSDEEVLGYAGLAAVPPEADVQTIAVAPEARGIGLGAALLESLLAEAGTRDCTTVVLEVAADNAAAITLYRSRGFEQIASRRDYYGPGQDALIMRRRRGGVAHDGS